jgi:hypothetical protein
MNSILRLLVSVVLLFLYFSLLRCDLLAASTNSKHPDRNTSVTSNDRSTETSFYNVDPSLSREPKIYALHGDDTLKDLNSMVIPHEEQFDSNGNPINGKYVDFRIDALWNPHVGGWPNPFYACVSYDITGSPVLTGHRKDILGLNSTSSAVLSIDGNFTTNGVFFRTPITVTLRPIPVTTSDHITFTHNIFSVPKTGVNQIGPIINAGTEIAGDFGVGLQANVIGKTVTAVSSVLTQTLVSLFSLDKTHYYMGYPWELNIAPVGQDNLANLDQNQTLAQGQYVFAALDPNLPNPPNFQFREYYNLMFHGNMPYRPKDGVYLVVSVITYDSIIMADGTISRGGPLQAETDMIKTFSDGIDGPLHASKSSNFEDNCDAAYQKMFSIETAIDGMDLLTKTDRKKLKGIMWTKYATCVDRALSSEDRVAFIKDCVSKNLDLSLMDGISDALKLPNGLLAKTYATIGNRPTLIIGAPAPVENSTSTAGTNTTLTPTSPAPTTNAVPSG